MVAQMGFLVPCGWASGRVGVPAKACQRRVTVVSTAEAFGRGTSLAQVLFEIEKGNRNGEWNRHLTSLIYSMGTAMKRIDYLLKRTALRPGEEHFVRERANSIMKSALWHSSRLAVLSSEQEFRAIMVAETYAEDYICSFDPLDEYDREMTSGVPTGSIFGIYPRNLSCLASSRDSLINEEEIACLQMSLQPGSNLIASGYCTFSSSTSLTLCLDSRVHMFVLDTDTGEFVLAYEDLQVPSHGYNYSFNEAIMKSWSKPLQNYVQDLRSARGPSGEAYESRYVGSLVADAHRTLLNGGILGLPGDIFDRPNGHRYLVYEANPIAHVFNCAGGMATDGKRPILDIIPNSLKQTCPLFLGSQQNVRELEASVFRENNSVLPNRKTQAV